MAENNLRVSADESKCLASSLCESIAPDAFRVEDGKVRVLDTGSVDRDTLIDAVMACPTKALTVDEADGTRIWP